MSELHFTIARGKFLFYRIEHVTVSNSREQHLELKVFPSQTEKVYCIMASATDAYATVSFLAPDYGQNCERFAVNNAVTR